MTKARECGGKKLGSREMRMKWNLGSIDQTNRSLAEIVFSKLESHHKVQII